MHFLAALPHLAAGGRHAFRLIASSVRTNFAEERGEVDFSPPLAQFGSTHAARLLHACAKGTSQIAHRISLSVQTVHPYVQFGTSLSHIKGRCIHWRASARSARSALDPVASLTFAAAICCLRTNAIAPSEAKPGLSQSEHTSLLTHGQPAADLRGCANLLCAPFPRRAAAAGGRDQKVTKGRRSVTFKGPQGRWIRSV